MPRLYKGKQIHVGFLQTQDNAELVLLELTRGGYRSETLCVKFVCMHVHMYVSMYVCVCGCTYVIYVCVYVCVCMWMLLCIYVRMYVYCKLKEEALDRTLWRTRFGRGYGPVVTQTAE
jgi:hypothetical protein